MLNIAIGHGTDAREVGRYRAEDARRTNGVVVDTAGVVAGTTTGVVAGTTTGVVAGTLGMDAHPVRRYRVEDAHPIDGEGEAGLDLAERRSTSNRGEYREAVEASRPNVIRGNSDVRFRG